MKYGTCFLCLHHCYFSSIPIIVVTKSKKDEQSNAKA